MVENEYINGTFSVCVPVGGRQVLVPHCSNPPRPFPRRYVADQDLYTIPCAGGVSGWMRRWEEDAHTGFLTLEKDGTLVVVGEYNGEILQIRPRRKNGFTQTT